MNCEQMEIMHNMCQQSFDEFKDNINRFMMESSNMKYLIVNRAEERDRVINLTLFDKYMSEMTVITNLIRKLNIHLNMNSITKSFSSESKDILKNFIDCHASKTHINVNVDSNSETDSISDVKINESHSKIRIDTKNSNHQNIMYEPAQKKQMQEEDRQISILPPKDMAEFKENLIFFGAITFIEDFDNQIFYISQMNDINLLKLSNMNNLPRIAGMPSQNQVFGISIRNDILRGILRIRGDNKFVLLVDFGEEILIGNKCKFYKIPKIYHKIPPKAFKCKLLAAIWANGMEERNSSKLSLLLELNEFKEVALKIVRNNGNCVLVHYYPDFVKQEYEERPFVEDDRKNELHDISLSVMENAQDVINIIITHVVTISKYYVNILDNTKIHKKLVWPDGEISLPQKAYVDPKLHDIVLTQNLNDEYWYRGQIVHIDKDKKLYKIFFIDYGYTEYVPLSCLAVCNPSAAIEPHQAVVCRLAGIGDVVTTNNPIYTKTLQDITNILQNQNIQVKVIARTGDELIIRIIDNNFIHIYDIFKALGYKS